MGAQQLAGGKMEKVTGTDSKNNNTQQRTMETDDSLDKAVQVKQNRHTTNNGTITTTMEQEAIRKCHLRMVAGGTSSFQLQRIDS
jgi:hypothetical protein